MQVSGVAVCVGDDLNTDVIYPGRHLAVRDPREQAIHLFEALGPALRERLASSGVLVGGWNLGCGSSREHAVTALLGNDVRLVIAKSFSRIFFRNAVNNGLPVVASPDLSQAINDGDSVRVNLAAGVGEVGDQAIKFVPMPAELLAILTKGGLWAAAKSNS
jgi:3-isopropylmalate dehydratase small subunit